MEEIFFYLKVKVKYQQKLYMYMVYMVHGIQRSHRDSPGGGR